MLASRTLRRLTTRYVGCARGGRARTDNPNVASEKLKAAREAEEDRANRLHGRGDEDADDSRETSARPAAKGKEAASTSKGSRTGKGRAPNRDDDEDSLLEDMDGSGDAMSEDEGSRSVSPAKGGKRAAPASTRQAPAKKRATVPEDDSDRSASPPKAAAKTTSRTQAKPQAASAGRGKEKNKPTVSSTLSHLLFSN